MIDVEIQKWIKHYESLDLHIYTDTSGHSTIGWGRNLKKGIRLDEAELMFQNDLRDAVSELEAFYWYNELPKPVQNALVNMNFNLGIVEFLNFRNMIHALIAKDYTKAAQELLESSWAKQVGKRAKDIAVIISQG